jgi:hypothetical protein
VGRDARLILCDIAADPVNTVTVSLGGKSTNSSQIHYLRLTLFSVDFHQIDNVRQRILQERQRNFRRGCHGRIICLRVAGSCRLCVRHWVLQGDDWDEERVEETWIYVD